MKKKIIVTVLIGMAAGASVFLAVQSYQDVQRKLNLEKENQKTMVVMETEEDEPEEKPDAPVPTDTPQPTVTEAPNPEAPVLILKQEEVKIHTGDRFRVVSQVDNITDDEDSRSWLFRNIEVFGEYDTNTPGEYRLEYVVTDSDGNKSIPQVLTLTVEEE